MMDIFATGNTFIAYPEEDMDLDVWDKAKEANKTAIVSPYMGFIYEKPDNAELVEKMKALSASILEKIRNYDLEEDRAAKIAKINKSLADSEEKLKGLKDKVDAVEPYAQEYLNKIADAEAALKPLSEALAAAKSAISPYDTEITKCKNEITSLNNRIKVEKAKKPTEAEPDLGPDQALIDEWTAEIANYELLIREQRGYSYELRKELAAAQAAYDAQNAIVKQLNEEYKNRKYSDDPELMQQYEEDPTNKEVTGKMTALNTTYEARLSNYEREKKTYDDLTASLDTYFVPDQAKIDADYEEISKEAAELTALVAKLEAEKAELETAAEGAQEAVIAATAALDAAKAVLDEKEEAFKPFNKENAVALSYIEDKETEIASVQKKLDDENAKASPSESKINDYTAQLETLNGELSELQAAYEETVAKGAAEKQAYEEALADYNAKADALKAAENAEPITALAAKKEELAKANDSLKKATKSRDDMLLHEYEYYDNMAKTLYNAFFKELIAECEADPDYQLFMNIGEETADDEKGIVVSYNTWYDSMYGAG